MAEEEGEVYEPDPRTLVAAATGDVDAFEELVEGYRVPVWRFLTHLVADRALAEDLTQETFLRMHRSLDGFEGRSKFSTWVFSIARNLGIDALRRRERRNLLPVRIGRPPTDTPSPEDGVAMFSVVAELDASIRECLLLVEVLGLTYREVGDVVGIPEGTAKSRVFRARRDLAARWAESEVADEV